MARFWILNDMDWIGVKKTLNQMLLHYNPHHRFKGSLPEGHWSLFPLSGMGHMARDCSASPTEQTGKQGAVKQQPKGQAGQKQKGQASVYAVTAENAPAIVAGKELSLLCCLYNFKHALDIEIP
ncbi:hypothetical protein NE237_017605 [Protea cynaroides]|uniref:Uncharacterized protein n=1 Tax=Protea cynaroides TaxID=273540 RepID=A0A9Q0K8B0_9MAGN|nr:hypothetical protein NE237_017605 [Protea cynaroides]